MHSLFSLPIFISPSFVATFLYHACCVFPLQFYSLLHTALARSGPSFIKLFSTQIIFLSSSFFFFCFSLWGAHTKLWLALAVWRCSPPQSPCIGIPSFLWICPDLLAFFQVTPFDFLSSVISSLCSSFRESVLWRGSACGCHLWNRNITCINHESIKEMQKHVKEKASVKKEVKAPI